MRHRWATVLQFHAPGIEIEFGFRIDHFHLLQRASKDAAKFPDLAFHGSCEGDHITGSLLLHGQTHPFTLDFESSRSAPTLVLSGSLHRADWGMEAHRVTAGPTVRFRAAFPNPANESNT